MAGLTVPKTLGAWLSVLQALLPPGSALSRDPRALLTKLLTAIAALLLAAQLRLEAALAQFDPRVATSMLIDWERLLGLPDKCTSSMSLTLADRQRLAYARLLDQGGQSIAYFRALASSYGEPDVKILDGFKPMACDGDCNDALFSEADRFVWQVRFQHPAANSRAMTCNDACDMALRLYTPSLAECPLNERKPAHTVLVFNYQPTTDSFLARLALFVRVDTLPLAT